MNSFKKSLAFFVLYLKKYKWSFLLILIAVSVSTWLSIKSPEFISEAINELGQYVGAKMTTGTGDKSGFYHIVRMMIYFALSAAVINLVQNVIMVKISGNATNKMREDLFTKLEKLPVRFFDKTSDGDILARFTSDLDNISNTLNQSIHEFMANIAMFITVTVMMFMKNVELSLVVLALFPVAVIVAVMVIRKAQKYVTIQQKKVGELNGFADERFSGQKLIIANGLQDETIEAFGHYNQELFNATYKGQLYSNLLFPTLQGISLLSTAIVIFYGAWMTMDGRLSTADAAGLIFLYSQYARMFYMPLTQIASQYTQMQLAFTGAQRIMEVLDEKEEQNFPNAHAIDGITGDVILEDVSFGYDEELVLKNINMSAKAGQMVALVGHTGSGKTTIMNLLNRFYNVTDGQIRFDDTNINDITLDTLRSHVGIVLQDSVLFSGTIAENIAFGKPDATREEIITVAKRAHIHEFIETLENGYDTQVSDENSGMSVGEKQLLSIARTMITNPDLLILDEATSNVDTVTEHAIQKAMDEVIAGRTSFVIAHRLKTILNADKIIVLQKGEIMEEGTHESLLADGGLYAELYENQFVFE